MTSPQALPPHQDPTNNDDPSRVTIMEYITTIVAQLDRRFDTLHQDLKDSIIERFAAVYRAQEEYDLRYQQRFDAQREALAAAFLASETATRAALSAADKAVAAAMSAAEKAVTKAELASEKRFDAVNEFRAQLADQAATFIPRLEAEQRIAALSEKVDILRNAASEGYGRGEGLNAGWVYLLGGLAALSAIVSLFVALAR